MELLDARTRSASRHRPTRVQPIIQNFAQRMPSSTAREFQRLGASTSRASISWSGTAFEDLGPHTDPPRPTEMRRGRRLRARAAVDAALARNGDPLVGDMLVLLAPPRARIRRSCKIAGVAEIDAP